MPVVCLYDYSRFLKCVLRNQAVVSVTKRLEQNNCSCQWSLGTKRTGRHGHTCIVGAGLLPRPRSHRSWRIPNTNIKRKRGPGHMNVALRHKKCSFNCWAFRNPLAPYFQQRFSEDKGTYESADSAPPTVCTIGDEEPCSFTHLAHQSPSECRGEGGRFINQTIGVISTKKIMVASNRLSVNSSNYCALFAGVNCNFMRVRPHWSLFLGADREDGPLTIAPLTVLQLQIVSYCLPLSFKEAHVFVP
jgi:hypothetical protein